ncbi:MAG: AMP-binding protein [Gammaproteobacteria bacterium]|nr:AMP-binding protein [Gammaproteobacteria bacterium]
MHSNLPLYRRAIDFDAFDNEFAPPDIFAETTFKASGDEIRALQEQRFQQIIRHAWTNEFYRKRWTAAGLEEGDVRSLDDIVKLPTYTTEDVKDDQAENPPYGFINGVDVGTELNTNPLKIQTSSGTTGKPRPSLLGVLEWELIGLQTARSLYIQGARPGDVMQIPATNSLSQFAWVFYKAAHDYLGILPITTGSGVVTPSRKQLEIAFDYGTNILPCFPEYLTSLAKTARDELGRDVKDLRVKFIPTFLGPDTEGALRKELEDLYGCDVYDNYGTNEISIAAFEGPDKDGLYIMEDLVYLEILDTETGEPVAPGETGNLVATCLSRRIPPVIRLNLRDLSRVVSRGESALGSSFQRIDHFLGRSDDMVKIRGTNVYPMACLNAVKSDPRTTGEWFCIATRSQKDGVIRDDLTVQVEVSKSAGAVDGLEAMLSEKLKSDLSIGVIVELVEEGSLTDVANIGKEGKAKRLADRRFEDSQTR